MGKARWFSIGCMAGRQAFWGLRSGRTDRLIQPGSEDWIRRLSE